MEELKQTQLDKYSKILVPASSYNCTEDCRLLIPFTSGEKIGFVNNNREIIVQPQYAMYYGEIYNEDDYMKVATVDTYGFPRSGGKVTTYKRFLYGLIDSKGNEVLKPIYFSMLLSLIGEDLLITVQREDYKWGVIDINGKEVISFGKYDWIDGFDHGYTRVNKVHKTSNVLTNEKHWGIINEIGEEVLPLKYDRIWNFYGKNRYTVCIEKDGVIHDFTLKNKVSLTSRDNEYNNHDDYVTNYGE